MNRARIRYRTSITLSVLGALLWAGACGSSQPTQQLVDARRAYDEARASEAATLTPDKLLTAEQALKRAEKAHDDDAGSTKEKHLAYLASRKAHIAMAYGKIVAAKQAEEQAEARYVQSLEERAGSSSESLSQAQQSLSQAEQELARERQARAEAERRAQAALASLQEVAKVNEEQRGTVITLPGGVLFPTGGTQLSPSARQSLSRVADALSAQSEQSTIIVEGHTDSRGSDQTNERLSQQRADAVKQYLIERGVPSERIQAVGKGEGRPIAPNDTADGRATNRRVEIVVSHGGQQQSQGMSPQQGTGTTGMGTSGSMQGGGQGGMQRPPQGGGMQQQRMQQGTQQQQQRGMPQQGGMPQPRGGTPQSQPRSQ